MSVRAWKFRWITLLALVAILLIPLSGRDVPQSIILIIADGTGIGQHTMTYYYTDRYAPAAFEHVGLMATHPADKTKVTGSAAAGTALATGVKTNLKVISLDVNNRPLKTVLEYAKDKGMATGLITTHYITDATPAAFAAHVKLRSDREDIARQMAGAGINVLFGGGRKFFLSKENGGEQEVDLLEVMADKGAQVIDDLNVDLDPTRPVVGLFAMSGMPDAPERVPSITEMALKAVDILDDDPDGFFLMVEEEMTDNRSHGNDTERVLDNLVSLNDLIDAMLAYQKDHPHLLVLFVADHETGGWILEEHGDQAGVPRWTTTKHTGNLVPIFATGPGGEAFDAVVDNTFIGQTLIRYVTSR